MSPSHRTCRPASERALRVTAACFFAAALLALVGAIVARLPGLVASAACFTVAWACYARAANRLAPPPHATDAGAASTS